MDEKNLTNNYTGLLLNPDNIKLNRFYFQEMCRLIGIKCIYRAPREDKNYNGYGELDSFYYEPQLIECIYDEHPNQKTMKKLGWVTELEEQEAIIHVAYDTFKLQVGSIFIMPSAYDNTEGRIFRVLDISSIAIYPSSVTCKIGPLWKSTFEKTLLNHTDNNFSLLAEEEEDN